jgi:hypothetical protein
LELPDGGGVVIEPICALCHGVEDAMTCPICGRLFCADGCFEVHLNARDALDSREAVDKFLASPDAVPFKQLVDEYSETKIDWLHTRNCDDCRAEMHQVLVSVLVEGLKGALQEGEDEA